MKKEKIGKIIGIIIFTLFVFGISYVTTYYVDEWHKGDGKPSIKVVFDDNEYYIMPNNEVLTKENALLEWPYIFKVHNEGDKAGIYQIMISDDSLNDIKREELSYVLMLDNEEIKSGKLDEVKNNVLYENKILNNQEQKYKLYIYRDKLSEEGENAGNTYKYSLKLNAIEEGGPGF